MRETDLTGHALLIVENLSVPFDRRVWRECLALRSSGMKVTAISPAGRDRDREFKAEIEGITIYRYPVYESTGGMASYLLEYMSALIFSSILVWWVHLRNKLDVVQICNPPDLLILCVLPLRWLGVPVIFDQHDLSPEIYEAQRGTRGIHGRVVKILRFFERLTYRFSSVVMVVNDSCRGIALNRGRKAPEDIFVVRNGPSQQALDRAQPSRRLRRDREFLVGYVGMMGPQEGIDGLLRIMRRIIVDGGRTDVGLHVVGGGTVLEKMKAYAKDLGIEEYVTFAGAGSYEQVLECIATADVCVCPDPKTPLSDKCSFVKAVEYMCLGKPFVAFSLEELQVMAGESALFARPGDEVHFAELVLQLLDQDELRWRLGTSAKLRAMQYLTWERAVESLLAAYRRALKIDQ